MKYVSTRGDRTERAFSEILLEGLPAYLQRIQAQISEAAIAVQKAYFLH